MTPIEIVHLEDDPLDAELVVEALRELRSLKFRIRRVAGRAEFLTALTSGVDLVLADYRVPGFGGEEALSLSLQLHPEVPLLFVSGAIGEEAAIDLVKRGATDYVLKDRIWRLGPAVVRALEEARERTQRRRAESALRFLSVASAALASTLDPTVSIPTLAGLAVREVFDGLAVDLLDKGELRRVAEASRDGIRESLPPPGSNIGAEVGASLFEVAIPGRTETLGRLVVAGRGGMLDEQDRMLARELSVRIASSIENARLLDQTRNAVRVRQELLAVVSHDLRNPLAAIFSATSVVEKKLGGQPDILRWIATVRRSVGRMETLIHDLLDLAAIEADKVRLKSGRHSAASLLGETVELFRSIAHERGVAIDVECDPALELDCDRERILQVLSNLVGNAMKFTRSRVWISARRSAEVELAVEDDGPGIPEAQLPHLFDRYWSADRERRGVGLGLAIVKALVEAHGGHVVVDSRPGKGTRFRVRLPAEAREARSDVPEPRVAAR